MTPSEDASRLLKDYVELRDRLRSERIGDGGTVVCSTLSDAMDRAIVEAFSTIGEREAVALIAVGGYGREELNLFSDIDLMVLHSGTDPAEAAAAMFRPLWDAGLKVGHAVRSVPEAVAAAKDRFDTLTTLLTGRYVAGDRQLFESLTSEITRVVKARPVRRHLVAAELERRHANPYLLMETDVKEGRGGLRTLQALEWERRREQLLDHPVDEPEPGELEATANLLAIRNAIHAVAGRSHDVYSYDLRGGVARWLDMDSYDVGSMLVAALRFADDAVSRRWPELIEGQRSPVRRFWTRVQSRNGEMTVPVAPLSGGQLAAIFRGGESGRFAASRLRERGQLTDILPEWDDLLDAPHMVPFHEHPIDHHLWRTVDEMQRLRESGDDHFSEIAGQIASPNALTFAAFLHDIGKARPGDHSEVGADIARAFCSRLHLPADMSALIEGAVRHHLLLAFAATRRDLDDPAVIADVAETIGDIKLLRLVYLLTAADSIATGASMWSPWKAKLVRTLYERCAAHLGEPPEARAPGTTIDAVLEAAGSAKAGLEQHVAGMPADYLATTRVDDVLWHAAVLDALSGAATLAVRTTDVAETALVVGRLTQRFRKIVADVFAANGVDVLEARMATRGDGIAVDEFRVGDDRTGHRVPDERWARVRNDIAAGLAGELDTDSKVAERARAYATVATEAFNPEVDVSIDEATDAGVITVRCADRIGRLAEILAVIADCGFEIRLAKLDSRSGEIVDTFHVPRNQLPDESTAMRELAVRIQSAIEP